VNNDFDDNNNNLALEDEDSSSHTPSYFQKEKFEGVGIELERLYLGDKDEMKEKEEREGVTTESSEGSDDAMQPINNNNK